MKPLTSSKIKLVSDSALILAVDAATFNPQLAKQTGRYLADFYGRNSVKVRPVFVLSPDFTTRPRSWFEDLVPTLREQAIRQIEAALSCSPMLAGDPEILIEARPGVQALAERLGAFAKGIEATAIIVPKIPRRYLNRGLQGGFTTFLRQFTSANIVEVTQNIPTDTIARMEARLWRTCQH